MNKDNLIIGQPYFEISYFDQKMSIPEILTHIYIGENVLPVASGNEESHYYFQDAESYCTAGSFLGLTDLSLCNILKLNVKTLSCISDLAGLKEAINRLHETGTGLTIYKK